MNLPPSEENIGSVSGLTADNQAQPSQKLTLSPPVSAPHANTQAQQLRITSEPIDPAALQAQALFADQTDSQLTQGSTNVIHPLPNSSVKPLSNLPPGK